MEPTSTPNAAPEPVADQQPAATPPSTPPSITGSMDELGERLETKHADEEAAPLGAD